MRIAIVILLAGALVSCNVVTVHEEGNDPKTVVKKIEGIPFYKKTEQFTKKTVYLQTWLQATLTVHVKTVDLKEGKEVLVNTNEVPYSADVAKNNVTALANIKAKIVNADRESAGTANEVIAAFRNLPELDRSTVVPELVSNAISSEWVVDRRNTYFLNGKQPWFGSATLTYKLAADGTLSEGTSTADTKLAEGLSGLIPFKEFLTGKFVETPKEATESVETDAQKMQLQDALSGLNKKAGSKSAAIGERDRRVVYDMSLAIAEVGYEYTLSTPPRFEPFSDVAPLDYSHVATNKALFSRKDYGKVKEEADDKDKDESSKVGIAGSISFPKDWGTTPAPSGK